MLLVEGVVVFAEDDGGEVVACPVADGTGRQFDLRLSLRDGHARGFIAFQEERGSVFGEGARSLAETHRAWRQDGQWRR